MTGERSAAHETGPELSRHAVIAGFQAILWLWVLPSAWRSYLAGRNPPLRPDFTLGDLNRAVLADGGTRRLLAGLSICWCALAAAAVILVALLTGRQSGDLVFAVAYGFALSVAGTMMISSFLSVSGGVTGGLAISTVFALAAAKAIESAGSVGAVAAALSHISVIVRVAGGISTAAKLSPAVGAAIVFGVGLAGSTTAQPAGSGRASPLAREVGGVVVGVVVSGFLDVVVLRALFLAEGVANRALLCVVFGLLVGLPLFSVALFDRSNWRGILRLACAFGALAILSIFMLLRTPELGRVSLIFGGISTALLYSSLFTLAFSAGVRVADPSAGAVASALGSGIPFVVFLSFGPAAAVPWYAVPLAVVAIFAGLLFPHWSQALVYPFEMAWNMVLLRADQRRPAGTLVRRNAAFWDERQSLPFRGLDEHLLLALERAPEEARRALTWLGQGPQSWAARAVRIELCARQLEQCTSIETIAAVHRQLPPFDDAIPADPIQYFRGISHDVHAACQLESSYHRHALLRSIQSRLSDLMLQGLPGPHAGPLPRVLARWNQVVGGATEALAATVRERGEIENPYVIGVPLTPEQRVFVGRTEISARIAQALLGPHAPPLLLYGQRRMGKTSLLNNLGNLLPERIVPLFVDLQGPASYARDAAGFLSNVARALADSALRLRGVRLPRLAADELASDPFGLFDRWLDHVEAVLGNRVALLAFDEFEALEASLRQDRLDEAAVLGLLRHIVQHRRQFRVVVAASHSIEELGRIGGYLINLQMLKMGCLTEGEACQLIEHPLRDFALRYDREARDLVIGLTSGHPHLLQSLCYELVTWKNGQSAELRYQARVDDVERAAEHVERHGSLFFLDIAQNQLTPEARTLAVRLAREPGMVAGEERAPLDLLLRRDLVEKHGSRYRFQVELIRRWFASRDGYGAL